MTSNGTASGTTGLTAPPPTRRSQTTGTFVRTRPQPATSPRPQPTVISGVMPHLTVRGENDHARRTETGIGGLMPWAGKLWMISYVAHMSGSGGGTGLWTIDADFTRTLHPESIVGTYANRMVHRQSMQLMMGPHAIDVHGNVRTIPEFAEHRLTATMEHLFEPDTKVYQLTMEGLLFEMDVHTLEVTQVADLMEELDIASDAYGHFKGGHTAQGRVVVANNTYEDRDFLGEAADGRLAEWDGTTWTVLERAPFVEVTGRRNMGEAIFATGWDRASAILKVFAEGEWHTYRLPKASHTFDHMFCTEWPRIREVESERFLMDCHFMFYELTPLVYGGRTWGVRPISTHMRIIPDFCSWNGMLVLSGNQVTPINDTNLWAGEPQNNLWFGKTDDLWQFGKPAGWGGPWWKSSATANEPSDPYLMTGFEHKVLHLTHEADTAVTFTIQVDFLGDGSWATYGTYEVGPNGYTHHEFPSGFSAHWVRLLADTDCTATAYLTYT
ncbi:MAG TPA: hypothetical protein VGT61_10185 [Thermomicrobiales bacterium]|nr:hypothetical protein [Thermomicrobiales bacterium]